MKKTTIQFPDFQKLDLRVGEVKSAEGVEGSTKLIALQVDLGTDYGTIEILTGMRKWFEPEHFVNKKFLFLANLEPRPMMGRVSNGMLLSAAKEDGTPDLVEVSKDLQNGMPII